PAFCGAFSPVADGSAPRTSGRTSNPLRGHEAFAPDVGPPRFGDVLARRSMRTTLRAVRHRYSSKHLGGVLFASCGNPFPSLQKATQRHAAVTDVTNPQRQRGCAVSHHFVLPFLR